MDDDLTRLDRDGLVEEVKRLRDAIREHRDSSEHELCWHHPKMWALLPERTDPRPAVPAWPEFLRGCVRYRESLDRQLPDAPRVHVELASARGEIASSPATTICRIWRGWTTRENAAAYERTVRGEVIPGIEARRIPGFRHIDLLREEEGDDVQFVTLMWFDDLDAVKAFMGEDYSVSHVPAAARAVLARFDDRARHLQVLERRPQRV